MTWMGCYLPSTISKNERLLVAVEHSKPAVPDSANLCCLYRVPCVLKGYSVDIVLIIVGRGPPLKGWRPYRGTVGGKVADREGFELPKNAPFNCETSLHNNVRNRPDDQTGTVSAL